MMEKSREIQGERYCKKGDQCGLRETFDLPDVKTPHTEDRKGNAQLKTKKQKISFPFNKEKWDERLKVFL